MSVTKAIDVAYVRFRAPDLDLAHRFLLDFGMVDATPSQPAGKPLYMRGAGRGPFVHVTEQGEPGFAGFGIWVRDREDLDRLAGQHMATPLPSPATTPANYVGDHHRIGATNRVKRGPSHVQRLGHLVLGVTDFRVSEAWYKQRFGLLTSDEIQPAPGVAIGAFLRCDRGETPCDHHTLFLFQQPAAPAFMHAAFEVCDLDDLMVGHDHLKQAGYRPLWGIGRHFLGSQIFDYWLDPWGNEVEHWTDGDQLRASDGGGIGSLKELLGVQWGMPMPPIPGVSAS
jgi:catechol 2,3-dioxygenase-like lactoylglutathione lyase family enzyme